MQFSPCTLEKHVNVRLDKQKLFPYCNFQYIKLQESFFSFKDFFFFPEYAQRQFRNEKTSRKGLQKEATLAPAQESGKKALILAQNGL